MNLAQALILTDRGPQIDPEVAYTAGHPDPERIAGIIAALERRTAAMMTHTQGT